MSDKALRPRHPILGCLCAEGHMVQANKPDNEFPSAQLPTGGWAIFLPPVHDCKYIEEVNRRIGAHRKRVRQ